MKNKVITNKTLVCTTPGVFEYFQEEKPVLTKGNVIIKVRRIGICGTDLHAFEGTQPFFSYPRILGHGLSYCFSFAPVENISITPGLIKIIHNDDS